IQKQRTAGDDEAALALANIEVRQPGTHPHLDACTDALRAELLTSLNDVPAATAAIRAARESVGKVADRGLRARAAAVVDIAESIVTRPTDIRRSKALLDNVVAFFLSRGDHQFLPDVYLQRGRTFLQENDESAALADFETGIRELTTQRATV